MATAEIKNDSEILDKLVCDYGPTKYKDIVWAMEWARHLRRDEASRLLPMAEMIEKAMLDVISGKVTPEIITEATNKDMSITGKIIEKKAEDKKEKADKKEEKEKTKKS